MPKEKKAQLAQSYGLSITKTEAMKKYKLQAGDFATVLPIIRRPNAHDCGKTEMLIFNERDVLALVANLREATSAAARPTDSQGGLEKPQLAEPYGSQIMRSKALKQYKLTRLQIDRLAPTEIRMNSLNASRPVRLYNEADVQALAEEVRRENASTTSVGSPSKRQRPSPYNAPRRVIQKIRNFEEEALYGGPSRYDGDGRR